MADAPKTQKRKLVTLVAMETLTPYKAGEVFSVSEEDAELLLNRNTEKTDFGTRYPKVKVRKFDPRVDADKLLDEHSLNIEAHNALQKKLRPDAAPLRVQSSEMENDITKLLDDAGYTPTEEEVTEKTGSATTPAPHRGGNKSSSSKED
jgi:hypothetical protein